MDVMLSIRSSGCTSDKLRLFCGDSGSPVLSPDKLQASESIPESGSSSCGRHAMTFLGWMCRKDVLMRMVPMSAGSVSVRL